MVEATVGARSSGDARLATATPPGQRGPALLQDIREYIDRLRIDGHSIGEDHDDDPILLDAHGDAVDTWRENYPYQERMPRGAYDVEKYALQVELLKFQSHQIATGDRHVVVFEGRDAAGKGGTIKRFMEHLNPRFSRVVALTKPSDREQGQWYFQRYVPHLPAVRRDGAVRPLLVQPGRRRAGDGVHRRRRVRRCSCAQAPVFEKMLVDSGISVTKFWFSVTSSEQRTRFTIRQVDPVRRWKLSPMDLESLDKWDAYTEAKEEMFRRTDTDYAPWTTIKSNDKKRARINAMRYFLSRFDYEGKDDDVVQAPDPLLVTRGIEAVGD